MAGLRLIFCDAGYGRPVQARVQRSSSKHAAAHSSFQAEHSHGRCAIGLMPPRPARRMRPDALVFACLVLEACCAAKREDEKQSVRAEQRRRSIGVEERGAGRYTHMTIGGKEDRRPSISKTSWFSNASRNVTRIHCPRGLMDKASDSGSEDCQFDSDRG